MISKNKKYLTLFKLNENLAIFQQVVFQDHRVINQSLLIYLLSIMKNKYLNSCH